MKFLQKMRVILTQKSPQTGRKPDNVRTEALARRAANSTTDAHSASSTPIETKQTMAATIWNMVSAFSPKGRRVEGRCDMKFSSKISATGAQNGPRKEAANRAEAR